MAYNATATLRTNGTVVCVTAVELDGQDRVLRSAGHFCYWSGDPAYDAIFREDASRLHGADDIEIVRDGCAGYLRAFGVGR